MSRERVRGRGGEPEEVLHVVLLSPQRHIWIFLESSLDGVSIWWSLWSFPPTSCSRCCCCCLALLPAYGQAPAAAALEPVFCSTWSGSSRIRSSSRKKEIPIMLQVWPCVEKELLLVFYVARAGLSLSLSHSCLPPCVACSSVSAVSLAIYTL